MSDEIARGAPRERQTLHLPESKLESLREWALDGTGVTAAARVRDADGRIALVKNGWSDGWILPGGGVESGETTVEAARREVREETELNATIDAPLVVLKQSYVAAEDGEEWFTAEYVVYAARADGEIPDASRLGVAGEGISAARWFDRVPENLHDGELLRGYL
ncbi:NUDIX hydrolase [Haladaptatus sp. R4]|uniref:NUDIX hydrolase n=1 Tax=Haladaptatus sp. R4 TaxID=1679489 RepID=UPI0007B4F690|nr:NUDIX hydrolase [Haladaptatus sp. R4]KZN24425.1 NUDIX hydrolase [Haladaptatus sp. R4]